MASPILGGLLAALCLGGSVFAQTDSFPDRSIALVSGHPAGTGADVVARYFAMRLSEVAGQPVVVENKPGAFTMVGIQYVANAEPDGYTLHINAGNGYAMNPYIFSDVRYDPNTSLQPITTLMRLPFVLAVAPDSPYESLQDLTDHLLEAGEDATFGYSNNMAQVATSLYHTRIGADPVGVSYSGTPDAMAALRNGDLDYIISDAVFLMEQAQQGNARILAVTTGERVSVAPDVPAMSEFGIDDYDLGAWWAVWAPAGTPPEIVDSLEAMFNEIVASDSAREFMATMRGEPFPGTSEEMTLFLAEEVEKWGELVRAAGIGEQ